MFKKNNAVYIEKMNRLSSVTVSEEQIKFTLNYSSIEVKLEDVPKLLADFMELYAYAKPKLDDKTEKANAEAAKDKENTDEPIDLSAIPF